MAMWSDGEPRDDRMDRAIDDVARRMTEGAPDAAFKARVLARVFDHSRPDGPRHRSSHVRRRVAWIVSPLAAAAIVLLILFIWPDERRDQRVETPPPQPPAIAIDAPDTRPQEATPPTRSNVRRARDVRQRWMPPSDIETLAPPPLDVDSIALGEIEPASSIDIQRLDTITPIVLAPIDEGDRP